MLINAGTYKCAFCELLSPATYCPSPYKDSITRILIEPLIALKRTRSLPGLQMQSCIIVHIHYSCVYYDCLLRVALAAAAAAAAAMDGSLVMRINRATYAIPIRSFATFSRHLLSLDSKSVMCASYLLCSFFFLFKLYTYIYGHIMREKRDSFNFFCKIFAKLLFLQVSLSCVMCVYIQIKRKSI